MNEDDQSTRQQTSFSSAREQKMSVDNTVCEEYEHYIRVKPLTFSYRTVNVGV